VLAALALFAVSLRPEVYQPPVAIIALALAGSYLGLFLFNWYPARIFSGTAGVFVAGFAIAYLSIFAGMKIATAFLVLGIPILDALWVIWKRFQLGESLAHPDKKHLHHWLLTLGWDEKMVSFFLLSIVFILTSSTFVFEKGGKFFSIIILFFFFVIFAHKRKNLS
jgi:UDP-GlcNAc:undecaprenyl-phosphate GlcNAc-1-phosphate transferase